MCEVAPAGAVQESWTALLAVAAAARPVTGPGAVVQALYTTSAKSWSMGVSFCGTPSELRFAATILTVYGPVVPAEEAEEVKSVGHSMTLDHDITDRQEILKYLLQLSEMVGRRARRYGVAGRTVHLTIRYADFTTFGKQQTRTTPTNQSEEIYRDAMAILGTFDLSQPVRLVGVRITNLTHNADQLPLFEQERKKALLAVAMDEANDRFGEFAVTFASVLETEEKGSHVISPAWRPDGIRRVDVK